MSNEIDCHRREGSEELKKIPHDLERPVSGQLEEDVK
jgi:hypothetical protein